MNSKKRPTLSSYLCWNIDKLRNTTKYLKNAYDLNNKMKIINTAIMKKIINSAISEDDHSDHNKDLFNRGNIITIAVVIIITITVIVIIITSS